MTIGTYHFCGIWFINISMSFAWLTLVRQLRVQYAKQVLLHFGRNYELWAPDSSRFRLLSPMIETKRILTWVKWIKNNGIFAVEVFTYCQKMSKGSGMIASSGCHTVSQIQISSDTCQFEFTKCTRILAMSTTQVIGDLKYDQVCYHERSGWS